MGTLRSRIGDSLAALREAFRNPDLRRVEFAWAGSSIGTYAYSIAVMVYAYHHGGATAVGVFVFVRLGIAATTAPVAGLPGGPLPARAGDARRPTSRAP